MRLRFLRLLSAFPVAGLLAFQPSVAPLTVRALEFSDLNQIQKRILSGFADLEINPDSPLNSQGVGPQRASSQPESTRTDARPNNFFPNEQGKCGAILDSNIEVNQNCLNLADADLQGRSQAQNETGIAQDPNNPKHLVAGYNDYRRGDATCGVSFSLDNGQTWSDSTQPTGFTRGSAFAPPPPARGGARQYWQAGGDPSIAWDTKGNAYYACGPFNRGPAVAGPGFSDRSSAIYVYRSTQNGGASWNFPGRPVFELRNPGPRFLPLEDKQYMTIDNHEGSRFQDRIYVTWTEFLADGSAYIWEAFSNDFGEHFGPRRLVSTNSPLCTETFGAGTKQGNCNENQFSQPFTAPDGNLYVVFQNFNNSVKGNDNRNQILLAKSTDGGNSFGPPVKVADFYDLPACAAFQGGKSFGRACVPEKGAGMNSFFRAENYPVGDVNPSNPRQIAVTVGSYINQTSNEANGCIPTGFFTDDNNLFVGVKTPGACNNKILLSVSNDGGQTFTGTTTDPRALPIVNQAPGQATTDQWWQWAAFTKEGTLAVSYYDRQFGDDETTGFSDISISGSRNLKAFGTRRVTSSSMPPPTQFEGAFLGDYSGLSVSGEADAHPLWADTRDQDLFLCPGTGTPTTPPAVCTRAAPNAAIANDQDVFTARVAVPIADEDEDANNDRAARQGGTG